MASYYGSINGADTYFGERLYTSTWDNANATDRVKALKQATKVIDSLNYKGVKATVQAVLYDADGNTLTGTLAPTEAEIIAADQSQELEFPRGKDSSVPEEIEWACYETAFALLDGFDPNTAADELRVLKQSYASVGTTYAEDDDSMEFLLFGIPNGTVWRWLKPRLVDCQSIRIRRVS